MTSAQQKQQVATSRKVERTPVPEDVNDTFNLKAAGSFLVKLINTHFTHV